ncbi:MAG: prepilin peptidase [Patescibacteria group bacterium]
MLDALAYFVLGAAFGSFLNVLAMRYEEDGQIFRNDIIRGRSRCSNCRKILSWYELVPILSFALQRGKCRDCEHSLSWQYPFVEILSGLIFVLVPMYFYFAPVWILIFLTLLLITLIDLRLSIIPDRLNIFLGVLGLSLAYVHGDWAGRIIGALVGFCLIGLVVRLSGDRGMGMGDWKMSAALGLIVGWPNILLAIASSFVLGGLVSIVLLLSGVKKVHATIPFGPFLAIGAALALIAGDQLIKLYL